MSQSSSLASDRSDKCAYDSPCNGAGAREIPNESGRANAELELYLHARIGSQN
jgi:hypothetical protein